MKNAIRSIAKILALTVLATVELNAQAVTSRDTVYTPDGYPDGQLLATIYESSTKNAAAVVLVHGLQMQRNAKTTKVWAEELAANGFTVFSIEYPDPTLPSSTYPIPPRALKTAVEFVRGNAASFNIDKIAAFGISAGSMLWGETITWENDDAYFGTDPSIDDHVDAAVLLYGLYDFNNYLQSILPIPALITQYFAGDNDARAKALAVNHAANVTAPVLLIHGTEDITLEYRQSVQFHDSLQANGKTSQLELFEGAGHVFETNLARNDFSTEGQVARDIVLEFLGNALGISTSVEETASQIPFSFTLEQNYPNPFNPVTVISYEISAASEVELTIYNQLGQKVKTLVKETQSAGVYQVQWDGKSEDGVQLSSGVYIYRIKAGDFVDAKKLALIR